MVVNSILTTGTKYQESSATFHMWNDNSGTYGLNFADGGSAGNFSKAVKNAVIALSCKIFFPIHSTFCPLFFTYFYPFFFFFFFFLSFFFF